VVITRQARRGNTPVGLCPSAFVRKTARQSTAGRCKCQGLSGRHRGSSWPPGR
jgi:hypothetical protein